MAYTLWDTDTSTGDSIAVAFTATKANVEAVDTAHLGSSAPATGLANGRRWADSTDTSLYVWKYRQNGAWVSGWSHSATAHLANAIIDGNGNEFQNLLLEAIATGSLSTTEARLQWDTTLNIPAWGDGTNTFYAGRTRTDASSVIRIPCALDVAGIAANPATTPSTSTRLDAGWQLDAAAETLNIRAQQPIPNGWTAANDMTLEVECFNLNTEAVSDTIDLGLTWRTVGDGELVSKTATTATNAAHVITSNTQYARSLVSITVDYDHASNPIAVDDLWVGTLSHDPTAGANPVAGIIVLAAYLVVPVFNYDA